MKIKPLVTHLSLILTTSIILPAYADISFAYKNGDQQKISENYLKTVDEEHTMIMSFKEKNFTVHNEADKYYTEMSVEDTCNAGKVVQQTVTDLAKDLPAEQREAMAGLFSMMQPQVKENKVEIINLGASDTIAGYKTTKYQVMVNGEVKEVVWQTTNKKISNAMQPLLSQKDEFSCETRDDYQDSEAYQALKGYPLKTYLNNAAIDESNGSFDSSNLTNNYYEEGDIKEVLAINFDDIANTEFEIPAGYEKTTWAEQMKKMTTSMQNPQAGE